MWWSLGIIFPPFRFAPPLCCAERPDVHYSLVAVDFMSEAALHAAIARVAAGAAAGVLQPLPLISHSLGDVVAALRQMSQARHVGKVVVRVPSQAAAKTPAASRVLVTGGLGTLGQLVTRWLQQQSAGHIQLLGRSGFASGDSALRVSSVASSAAVSISKADISLAADLAPLLAGSPGSASAAGRPASQLAAILHASGVLADATLANQTLAGIRAVCAPKVVPLHSWRRALAVQPAAAEVLFSSVASLLGAPGQANYSAANAALDGAARRAQQAGMASLSVQWGAWAGGGMASAETASRVERMGMGMVGPAAGLAALQGLLSSDSAAPVVGATPFLWGRFMQRLQPTQRSGLFAEFASQAAPSGQPGVGVAAGAAAAAGAAPGARLGRAAVEERVAAAAAAVLGGPVPPSASLMESGLDSLGAVELRNSLSKQFGLDLPATLTFDYPTTAAIAGFIVESLGPAEEEEAAAAAAVAAACAAPGGALAPLCGAAGAALAVSGVSLRFAGGIESVHALHAALSANTELQTVGPFPRWDTGEGQGLGLGRLTQRQQQRAWQRRLASATSPCR